MLQFITKKSERFSPEEQVRQAVEGGCHWVEIDMPKAKDEEVRKVAEELIPLCTDTDTFMILRNRVDLVEQLRVSGVYLDKDQAQDASAVRDRLGPHAIIGVGVASADDVLNLRRADIDYAVLPPVEDCGLERYAEIVKAVRESECQTAIVATGDIKTKDVESVMATGVSGIAISAGIVDAKDMVVATGEYLIALGQG